MKNPEKQDWFFLRWLLSALLWVLTHLVYRIKVVGREHVPGTGGMLLVCNHLSQADAMLLFAAGRRRIRFLMYKGIYDRPWIKPFARLMGVIPISSELRPREMIQSLKTASEAIKNGEVVCIFAEGQITRIGQLLPFRRGFERIMKDVDAPIVPVALEGVWGSIFSFDKGRFLWKWPRRIPYPVTVHFGKPMPASATAFEVRQAVQDLTAKAWEHRKPRMRTLQREFVSTARRHPFRFAMADAQVRKLNFGVALTRTIFLARRLNKIWPGQTMVGLLLPPSVPGALVNYAALLCGKVPVNLNYTVSDETLDSCVRQCELQTMITSRAFMEKVKLTIPCRTLFLEELAAKPTLTEKLIALLMSWTLPVGLLEKALGREKNIALDDLATIIFSSGSTGDPKGVMLTHYNIASNVEQLGQTFAFVRRDCILGVLPFFHSFGFTGALILPAVHGLGVVYHPNPLDAKSIGPLVSEYAVTFLVATPTFLQMYIRGCSPEDFGSVQYVLVGAEKLPERIANAFEERFGVRPLEAYGCTECAPAVTVNTRDFRAAGFRQVGAKRGKIGHPLPGVSVRIVDPQTGEPLPVNQPGLLLVRGPNVMKGYLGRPEKTAEVLRDGWYVTGDIATLDEDGFLQITDRLSRFSKIGGEMVPHLKVEEAMNEILGESCSAVTAVPDPSRGERLIAFYTRADVSPEALWERLGGSDLPKLWIPRRESLLHLDAIPALGTGKVDLRRLRELALERAGESAGPRQSTAS